MKKLLVVLLFVTSMFAQLPENPKPKFLTKSSTIEMALVAASIAADGWSTRDGVENKFFKEANPIARPFVHSNGKASLYFGSSLAAVVGANYLLRNHTRVRHIMNWSIIGVESYLAIDNATTSNSCGVLWVKQGIVGKGCRR